MRHKQFMSFQVDEMYIDPEIYADISSPDLPVRLPLNTEQLFSDLNVVTPTEKTEHHIHYSNRVIIRGRAGSGKSTLLLKLCNDWAAEERSGPLHANKAVFLLHMKYLNYSSNLGDAVVKQLLLNKGYNHHAIEEFLNENEEQITILLDGYDEFRWKVTANDKCGNIVQMLRKEYLPKIRILVSTRPGGMSQFKALVDNYAVDYRSLEISGFSPSQIDSYIYNVFKERKDHAEELKNYLEENQLKTGLASLPLMCCAFCQLTKWTDGVDFKGNNTMTALLDKLVECLIKFHPRAKTQKQSESASSTGDGDLNISFHSQEEEDSSDTESTEGEENKFLQSIWVRLPYWEFPDRVKESLILRMMTLNLMVIVQKNS